MSVIRKHPVQTSLGGSFTTKVETIRLTDSVTQRASERTTEDVGFDDLVTKMLGAALKKSGEIK